MNTTGKKHIPDEPPLGFMPKKHRRFVELDGRMDYVTYESAVLTAIREDIRGPSLLRNRFGRAGAAIIVRYSRTSISTPRTLNHPQAHRSPYRNPLTTTRTGISVRPNSRRRHCFRMAL